MYVNKRQVSVHQGIATLLAIALALWAVGAHMFTQTVEAANLTSISDTLTDSNPGSVSDHSIEFTTPNGLVTTQYIDVQFPVGFDVSSIVLTDITVDGNAVAGAPGVGVWGVTLATPTAQDFRFTSPTDGIASSTSLTFLIGGTNQIINPTSTTTSYEITLSGSAQDSGQTRVAIVDNVLVTANVDTTLEFLIAGMPAGTTVNGSATSTFANSANDALPFATLAAGVSKTLAQQLNVSTNAINGYVVTVEQDTQLQSSTGADIDGFVDGSWTNTTTAWTGPGDNVLDEDTWGHWGLTSTDATTTRVTEFGVDEWVAASTTPTIIMGHTGPSDGITDGVGSTTMGYQIQITALQEAGDDYNTTLTYIATPTF